MVTLHTENGYVRIMDPVFTTLVGSAATSCFGVKGMAMRSMSDGLVHLLRREAMGKGVRIICDEDNSITIELHIVVENGVNIPAICSSIISEIRYKIETATGVTVKSVDVFVDSMTI